MTDFMELVRARRSVRSYQDRAVEREKLDELAQALRLAPSASNQQPWRMILVDEPKLKDEVARATFGGAINFNKFTVGAPVLAVFVIEPPRLLNQIGASLQGREYPLIDIGIGAAQLCLRAAELGLGTCMLGWFDESKIKKLLGIPSGRRIGLVVTIGYPANGGNAGEKARKSLDEVRSYNAY
jgi:nitroreductase